MSYTNYCNNFSNEPYQLYNPSDCTLKSKFRSTCVREKKDLNDKIRGLQSTTCPPNLNTTAEFNRLLDSGIKSGIEKYQQTTEQSLRLSSEINYLKHEINYLKSEVNNLKRIGSEVQRALKIRIY
jgi:hypothetical protein